jgi:hypothetical protein
MRERSELAARMREARRSLDVLLTELGRIGIELETCGAPIELALLASVREHIGASGNGMRELARTLEAPR